MRDSILQPMPPYPTGDYSDFRDDEVLRSACLTPTGFRLRLNPSGALEMQLTLYGMWCLYPDYEDPDLYSTDEWEIDTQEQCTRIEMCTFIGIRPEDTLREGFALYKITQGPGWISRLEFKLTREQYRTAYLQLRDLPQTKTALLFETLLVELIEEDSDVPE